MKINWKVRFRNKTFLVVLFAAVISLVEEVLKTFGIDTSFLNGSVTSIFYAALAVLTVIGVVIDPTTAGTRDSEQALTYEEPRKDDVE